MRNNQSKGDPCVSRSSSSPPLSFSQRWAAAAQLSPPGTGSRPTGSRRTKADRRAALLRHAAQASGDDHLDEMNRAVVARLLGAFPLYFEQNEG